MREGRVTQYAGVLDIPEQRVCTEDGRSWEIRHHTTKAGESLPLATARTLIFGNPEQGSVTFERPVRWHHLLEDGNKWMTDYPIEQAQHDRELMPMRTGRVLVGGLGLGYAAFLLARRPGIREVVVVEKEAAVIHLVEDALRRRLGAARAKLTIIHDDLFQFLKDLRRGGARCPFGWAFYDIWTSDGEGTFFDTVLPLLDLSRGLVRRRPVNWNETVMRGQLGMALSTRLLMLDNKQSWLPGGATITINDLCEFVPDTQPGHEFVNWRVPFFRWARRNPRRSHEARYFQAYAGLYGDWDWEAKWRAFSQSTAVARRHAFGL